MLLDSGFCGPEAEAEIRGFRIPGGYDGQKHGEIRIVAFCRCWCWAMIVPTSEMI